MKRVDLRRFMGVILLALALCAGAARSQSVVNMVNGDSIVLNACTQGSGVIYDDGGLLGEYSNNFSGFVVIEASAGLAITLSGTYNTEECCDKLTIEDGTTTLVYEVGGYGTVNVSSTTGHMLIYFHTDGSVTTGGLVLNWAVTGMSGACPNPITSLDTTSVSTTSIGITWSAANASGPFTVVCDEQVFSGITSTSYTVTNLNPSSTYSISVVDAASTDNRCCAAQMMVRTACDNASLPYQEGFEGMAEASFPSCWLQVVNFDEEDFLPQVVTAQHSSGSRSLLLSCGNSESAGHFGIVATPPLEGVGEHTVRLMLRASHSGLYVEFGTCDSTGTDYNQYGFTASQGVYIDNTTSWQEYRISWTSVANGRRLAMRMQQSQQSGVGRRLYIDDMGIENCGVDSVRAMHVEFDRLDLLWSTYGNPNCTVGVRREGSLVDTLTFPNATSPLSITGLSADTRYTFTVYPTCAGSPSISRNITVRTAIMPTAADGYCSNFSHRSTLPPEWTFTTVTAYCGGAFQMQQWDNCIRFYDGCSGVEAYMASERLTGLPGKQVAVTFDGEDNNAMVILGTMLHADDPSTFVPLDTAYSDGRRHTLVATVPITSTGRHVAIRLGNPSWYVMVNVYSVTINRCALEEPHVLHRRGTSMELGWAQAYDTVLVQYGLRDFAIGTGTVDTFYHTTRGTITGLTPNTDYDVFVYRPCQTPCEDMRYLRRTAMRDYPLPYCEDFALLDDMAWEPDYGDWKRLRMVGSTPTMDYVPYYSADTKSLKMSSWGFSWDYYGMTMLPDVEVDSHSVLSFYIYDQAPESKILVGTVMDDYVYSPYNHFLVMDTIHINAYNSRVHYSYELRPSDTLFNGRLVLAYMHDYEYSYYNCYIDELQVMHPYYGTLQNTYTTFDSAAFNLTSLDGGADTVVVTLEGGGNTFRDTVLLADIHSIGFGGLDTGTLYNCYVEPYSDGCVSYAGSIVTPAYGFGYGFCFPFTDVLSDELPTHWAADHATLVTTGDELRMQPHGSVATHPMLNVADLSFLFRAKSSVAGDTLLVGYIPTGSVSTDSTHFGPSQAALFVPTDTMVLGTGWGNYMVRLKATAIDSVRMTFRAGNGITHLDDVEFSYCPIVHFTEAGNSVVCEMDNDQWTNYYLVIDDSAGNDHRVIYVESNPLRVEGLLMNTTYYFSWYCPSWESECRPTIRIHTGGLIPLPYCEDFNVGMGSISVPPTWTFVRADVNDYVNLDTWGPSLAMSPYGDHWMYAVLPQLDVDSALSLHGEFYTWTDGAIQIGVVNSAADTASFVPLWTSSNNDWQYPRVELSGYTDKRVAIRVKAESRIFNLHLYDFPLAKLLLVGHRKFKLSTQYQQPYWVHYSESWNESNDTMFYVNDTAFYIHDSNITYNGNVIVHQTDSAGYTCDNNRDYWMGGMDGLPYCYDASWGGFGSFSYCAYNQSCPNWILRDSDHRRALRFYGSSSSWQVMNDFNIDSIRHAGMQVRFDAGSSNDVLVVGVMYDAYDTSTFVPVDTLRYTRTDDSLQTAFVDFSSYTGEGRWIAFHHPWAADGEWIDIRYLYVERCPGALGAVASLSRWNRVKIDSPRVPFYVEYGYAGHGQGAGDNTIMRVDSVPVILTLDPETRYDFYFRCDSTNYSCVPRQQVVTLAAPMDLPTCVDFDTVVADMIPHNWTSRNPDIGATNTTSNSGTNCLRMPISSTSYIITPDINVDSIQKVAMSVWYKVEDLADRLVVGVMSNPADIATFHPVRTLAPAEVGVWQKGMVEFSSAPDDAHFIALRARSNRQAGGRNVYVDDIYVTDCAAFDFTVQRLTNNSIDLTWSHLGTPNITVTVEDDGAVIGTYNGVTPPLHIEPLDMLHYYTFRFNSSCNSTDTGFCSTNYTDSLSVVTPAPGTGCVNPTDMASPQAVFFTGTYRNPYSFAGAVNYGSQHPDSRHTVCYDTAQRDVRTGNLLRTIPEGYTSSVRLGNWSTNYYNPEAEGVIYSLLVDTSNFELLLLRYAAVLQDPIHAAEDQPRFRMELLDTNYNIIDSACTSADFIADQSLGWHSADDGVLWKDWTAVGIDLSAHAGQQVYFRLTTYDCNEGSHYGYAYFTLECMRKNMNTESCGDIDSNTLSAPEGFHYRWYTSLSNATVSTSQSITVPSQDITYYCDVSKLDNPNCHFLISAYGGTRYPMASFDTSIVVDSCRFYVTFTNTSSVSKDGVTPMAGEHCESAYWNFGNNTGSNSYHGYAIYTVPGTYTVQLISGIAMDECQDTAVMQIELTLPPGMSPADTTDASICDNQQYYFHGLTYDTVGTYYHIVPVPGQTCDSIYVLQLDVRPTSVGDTSAVVCDSINWRGNTYTTNGSYLAGPVGLNSVACDSMLNLSLTVNLSYELNDSIVFCPSMPFIYRDVDYGGPTAFDALLTTTQHCDSLVHVTLLARDSSYHLSILYRFDSSDWAAPDSLLKWCDPTILQLRDSTDGAMAWSWNIFTPDTMWVETTDTTSVQFQRGRDDMSAFVAVVITDTMGCYDTLSWPVFVFRSGVPDFHWNPERPAIHNPEAQFYNTSQPIDSVSFLWRIQRLEGGSFDTTTVESPFYRWGGEGDNMEGEYTVRLITSWPHDVDSVRIDSVQWIDASLRSLYLVEAFSHTCVDSLEQTVVITNDYLEFPNLVSPNGDGVNDIWVVVNMVEFGEYPMNELWIYDRTGALVYHAKNIRQQSQFWDPNATRSPDGTYYYRFTAKGPYGAVKRNGLIEVVR